MPRESGKHFAWFKLQRSNTRPDALTHRINRDMSNELCFSMPINAINEGQFTGTELKVVVQRSPWACKQTGIPMFECLDSFLKQVPC
ncbi:Uncharacterised protein [Enterobacter asburiae]|nr:Uncharacterised protein [Enterobacter asburiae]SAD04229.1 Uncharacterised protein [Enterobacter hormaechei]SAF45517.1 Uncharacterised protein [Enterobacter asburiae]SAG22425.1 Uncharacterised protein [Enterobacter asburiae]VAC78207.1 Uncharacterised protein [Enterobacter hormaechei]